jgi:hypothetical protein
MSTPPLKRTSSPDSTTSARLALSVPGSIFTYTGCSESALLLRISISASLN